LTENITDKKGYNTKLPINEFKQFTIWLQQCPSGADNKQELQSCLCVAHCIVARGLVDNVSTILIQSLMT